MATFSAAACAALTPLPTRIVDAIDDLECHFAAFEAVEALISAQKSDSREDLAHVNRESLGFLLTILNVNMRQKLEVARAHADALYQSQDICGNHGRHDHGCCHHGNHSCDTNN